MNREAVETDLMELCRKHGICIVRAIDAECVNVQTVGMRDDGMMDGTYSGPQDAFSFVASYPDRFEVFQPMKRSTKND